jgi:hypothetical protein
MRVSAARSQQVLAKALALGGKETGVERDVAIVRGAPARRDAVCMLTRAALVCRHADVGHAEASG